MDWHKWFIPHRDTHQKAHLITWHALIIYLLIFILLQTSFSILGFAKPGILGTSSNITQARIIELTNEERAKSGLLPLSENPALSQAAAAKAANMFEENYWAHFAPSGKTPWDFILGSGYKFQYAGENLAKNFSNSEDVVSAWMASPTHKENIIGSKYKEIGIAVVDGTLNGQQTTLVVQMFGSVSGISQPIQIAALPTPPPTSPVTAEPSPTLLVEQSSANTNGKTQEIPKEEYEAKLAVPLAQITPVIQGSKTPPLFDPYKVSKTFGVGVISMIAILLFLDLFVLGKRGVFRISSHHLAHMAILSVAAVTLISSHPGKISDSGITFVAPSVYEETK